MKWGLVFEIFIGFGYSRWWLIESGCAISWNVGFLSCFSVFDNQSAYEELDATWALWTYTHSWFGLSFDLPRIPSSNQIILYKNACMHVRTCVCVCTCANVCMYMAQDNFESHSSETEPCFYQSLSLTWNSLSKLCSLSSETQGSACFSLLNTERTSACSHAFCTWLLSIKHICLSVYHLKIV